MAPGYRLGEEERARVRDCLAKAGVSLPARDFYLFVLDIEASIGHFPAAPERSFREAHEALRTLWQCSREHSPLVDKLLALLRALPKEAIEAMSRRARRVIPALFPGETIEDTVFDPPERLAAGFLNWTATSEEKKLVTALRVLTSDGGRIIIGRSRGSGKRSRPRLEPTILGEVRGAGTSHHRGGPPAEPARRKLVMHLALDWCRATGEAPRPGRSDGSGFGDLVHCVFQWLDLSEDPTEAAGYALRRYWGSVEEKKTRARPFVAPPVCADCRWVQRFDASRDGFHCRRLDRAFTTARENGQNCGPKGALFEPPASGITPPKI